jgi:Tfp pilus assembly protein PilX
MSMKTMSNTHSQAGAVSLFVVIFATLLITVVTVSFLRLMINNQNQASNSDLSQSAYDSAQAGVEDAKRALLRYKTICEASNFGSDCDELAAQLETDECNTALRIGGVVSTPTDGDTTAEVFVEQSQGVDDSDRILDQAYTCVTIVLKTDDYLGSLAPNESKLVPLVGEDQNKDDPNNVIFDKVKVEWYSTEDLGSISSDGDVDLGGATRPLLSQEEWLANRPSVLRTQFMQFGSTFLLTDFDATDNGESNGNTVFLYPSSSPAAFDAEDPADDIVLTDRDSRKTVTGENPFPADASDTPIPVQCKANIAGGGYACASVLTLPNPIGGDANARTAFLRLTPFYNATHFRVTLYNGIELVKFDSVQPEVDSTGRANDLFRRLSSRVDLIDTNFPYPDSAVDVSGNLCKNFTVTDKAEDFSDGGCTP